MPHRSRWSQVEVGMCFDEVKQLFREDMWQPTWIGKDTWLVNNEADAHSDHGYMVSFDESGRVKGKSTVSLR